MPHLIAANANWQIYDNGDILYYRQLQNDFQSKQDKEYFLSFWKKAVIGRTYSINWSRSAIDKRGCLINNDNPFGIKFLGFKEDQEKCSSCNEGIIVLTGDLLECDKCHEIHGIEDGFKTETCDICQSKSVQWRNDILICDSCK